MASITNRVGLFSGSLTQTNEMDTIFTSYFSGKFSQSTRNSSKAFKKVDFAFPTIQKNKPSTLSSPLLLPKKKLLLENVGETYKKIDKMCDNTRKKLKCIIKSLSKRKNRLKIKFKKCEKFAENAYLDRFSEGLPQEFQIYHKKMQAKRALNK